MSNQKLGALVKTSLVDYPSRVACALFLHGCNLRCPYCYNKDLVCGSTSDYDAVTMRQLFDHLEKRQNVLSGFVISGGEPCLSPHLEELILKAKSLGYNIKLDTNGTLPDQLEHLLRSEQLRPDFIALDIKTSPNKYAALAPRQDSGTAKKMEMSILRSIELVSALPPQNREFRTVLVPTLITEADIEPIVALLPKDASWQFAPFQNKNCLDPSYNNLEPYSAEKIEALVALAKIYIPGAALR